MKRTGLITLEFVKNIIKERPEDIHKGQAGRVLIIAGSVGMAGAAVLTAKGALKSGAGLVKVAVPRDIFDILQIAVPQATCMDVENLSEGQIDIYDSIAIGPGLGVDESGYLLIKRILKNYNGPVVLDADGINCLCMFDDNLKTLKESKSPVVITPHIGEGDRLLEALNQRFPIREIGRVVAAEKISEKTGAITLLKGPGTVVTLDGQGTYINTTGNPGMATGGSGDVLTGVIASLLAYGIGPVDAAKAGAYMHGLAGDIAALKQGQWGMTSLDIEEALPAAFKQVVGK